MDAARAYSAEEVTRLHDCVNDLVSIMALPALWTGGEPAQIVSTLLDALLGTLRLGFVCVRLNEPEGGRSIEMVRVAESLQGTAGAREFSQAIDSSLRDAPPRWPSRAQVFIREVELSVACAPLGIRGEIGIVAAGCRRSDFPTQTERLVLEVAANQAAIGLQQALLSQQKRLAIDLDERVALRTNELDAANERLEKEAEEHRRSEAALHERERESRLIADSIPGLVATLTPTGEVESVNNRVLEYCGRTLEELKGWGTSDTVHPEDLPRAIEVITHSVTSGHPYEIVERIRRFDGVYRWFQVRGLPLRDSNGRIARWYALLTDIDDLKRAEEELRRAYDSFTDAQRLSKTGSFITDMVGDDHNWSEEAYRIFEINPWTKITVQAVRDAIHPEDLPSFDAGLARALGGADFDLLFRIVTASGHLKHVHAVGRLIERVAGRPLFIGAIQDVTENKVADEALNRARSELAHVARVTTLSTLTASLAHEVNQPLSGILTNASTCLRMLDADPPNVEGARETARRTIRDGNRASEVIMRLRALFSRRESTLESLDLNEATREVIALSLSDLQRNRVVLQSELADDLPMITGDRIQLQQVILNLLRNALEAMLGLHDRPRQLLIRTEQEDGDRVRVSVRDAGVGVDAQSMNKLFDAFYTTKSDGMGIGLSVSRSIIERHHGRLWAEPNHGPGATFSFSIPRSPESVTDTAPVTRHS